MPKEDSRIMTRPSAAEVLGPPPGEGFPSTQQVYYGSLAQHKMNNDKKVSTRSVSKKKTNKNEGVLSSKLIKNSTILDPLQSAT